MKKLFVVASMFLALQNTQAQFGDLTKKATEAASAAGFDVNKLTSGIMGQLTQQLTLTKDQQPKVTNVISDFLTQKSKVLPLQNSNPSAYTAKFGGLFNNLKTKLGGILLQNQMSKFMGLKPAKPSAANVLSQLFF